MNYPELLKWRWLPANDFQAAAGAYNSGRSIRHWPAVCHAPMRNMYIGHHGVVTACCYNRIHPLGIWPIKSLKEIWNSEKANELRQALKDYDLSKGCLQCTQQLMAHNFDAFKARQYDNNRKNHNGYPSVLEFELDNKCNLACTMCSEEFSSVIASNKGLPRYKTPYNQDFLEQLEDFIPHLEEAKFYGGEPFMIRIYYDIWERIQQINPLCRISIQTNATIMNERVRKLLQHPNIHFNISIDSLQKERYESIRIGALFEETMENIRIFHEYSRKHHTFFGVSACMMQNTVGEAPDFIRFCNRLNVPVYFHTVVQPEHLSLHHLNKTTLSALLQELETVQDFDGHSRIQLNNIHHYKDFLKQISHWLNTDFNVSKKKFERPVQDWPMLFDRIEKASINVYGDKLGKEKAAIFNTHIKELIREGFFQNEQDIFSKILHEDLSSSIHLIIEQDKEQIKQAFERSQL